MAATRLHPGASPQRVGIFGVIGQISNSGYVDHVGLLRTGNTVTYNAQVKIYHSGPPLQVGQLDTDTGQPVVGEVPVHLVGWIDDLEIEEWSGIQSWIEDVRTRISPGLRKLNYRIDPPFHEVKDPVTGRIIHCEYSCVGFVLRCYEEGAGIILLNHDPAGLPAVEKDILREIYGEIVDRLRGRFAASVGLPGDGPWKLVLSGYVFHALNRPNDQIRTTPYEVKRVEEAAFP